MLRPGQSIGVAVSGGADSVVLLHLLHRYGAKLIVLHVNHHLRGAESDADESFVRHLAQTLGLPLCIEQAEPPATNIEQHTRDLRRAFFQRAIRENSLHCVALGHTRSDQAETVLFRLLRGAGLTGLAGMRPVVTSDGLIRPLLISSRDEIRAWAASESISYRDDSSNLDTSFSRNRLRLETIPSLAHSFNPNIEALLAQSADLAQVEEDYWAGQVQLSETLVERNRFGWQISVAALLDLHLALRRRMLRQMITDVRGNLLGIQFDHIESILRLCDTEAGHDRVIIPGVDALRSFGQLLLSPFGQRASQERNYEIPLHVGSTHKLPFESGSVFIDWLKSSDSQNFCANFKKEEQHKVEISEWDSDFLDAPGTLPSLCVRNWQPGDLFQPAGRYSIEKVKTLFQEGKILLWERKHWPVVLAAGKIVWVRQFGASANVKASQQSRNVMRLIYSPA